MLLASTGTGKTFIAGAVIRRLEDIDFCRGKSFGVVKYLFVTRATIVEQTERVLKNFFSLDIKDGVEVVNIEQLRARAGKQWIDEEVYIEDGEEKTRFKWKEMLHPPVIILDECQGVKNNTSTQSKILQAYAELNSSMSHIIFMSATPFCKVEEAKTFVLNTHIEVNLY